MNRSYNYLGEEAIYPGHPVTIAYIIICVFPTYEEAFAKGIHCWAAIESVDIPGAGSSVYNALDMLRYLHNGIIDFDKAVEIAEHDWDCLTSDSFSLFKGQEQANRFKEKLREKSSWWKK